MSSRPPIPLTSREKLLARTRAIKVLDYALQTDAGSGACVRFVEMLGLKTFFSAFMGRAEKRKKIGQTSSLEDEEHMLSILGSLFTNLASESPERLRLVTKFVEGEYEKVDRLLEMREFAEGRVRAVDKEIAMERKVRVYSLSSLCARSAYWVDAHGPGDAGEPGRDRGRRRIRMVTSPNGRRALVSPKRRLRPLVGVYGGRRGESVH